MYAVIKTGGKQFKVKEGSILKIEKIAANEGENVDFNDVLLVADGETIKIGTPQVSGSKVTATVQAQARHKKVKIVKMRRRKHYHKQMGHRQYYTEVKITRIIPDVTVATVAEDNVLFTKPEIVHTQPVEVSQDGA